MRGREGLGLEIGIMLGARDKVKGLGLGLRV